MALERLTQITEVGIQSGITLRNVNIEGAYVSGVVTATSLNITGGGANFVGVVTATSFNGNVTGNITPTGLVVSGVSTFQSSSFWGDGDVAYFGDGQDLLIFHNSTDSIIRDNGTGDLNIEGGNKIKLMNPTGIETYAVFNQDGASELWYDNAKKFETTGAGVSVTGSVIASGVSTFSGGVVVSAGSTSVPSISPSGDSNTGIFFPSADTIAIAEGGVEVLRINSSGNIGIGTALPTSSLEVAQDTTGLNDLTITNLNTGNNITKASRIRFRLTDSVGTKKDIAYITAYTYNFDASTGNYLSFFTRTADATPTEKMRLDNDGNLVLGSSFTPTGTASQPLQVTGGAYVSGNLGIGTINPAYKLQASGPGGSIGMQLVTNGNSIRYANANTTAEWSAGTNAPGIENAGNYYSISQYGTDATWRERVRIDSAGRVTMPSQPAFMVRGDVTGSIGENAKFAFTSTSLDSKVTFDRLGNWSNANDRFTAPVTGVYHFYFGIYRQSATSTYFSLAPRVNNNQLGTNDTFIFFTSATGETANTDDGMYGSFTLNLSANDYVELFMRGGAQTISVYSGHSFFGGHLIG